MSDDIIYNQFSRLTQLIGSDKFRKLENSHAAVFGIGGVGSFAAEAIVRSGVGNITLVDNDVVTISNFNRQLLATKPNIGKYKTDAFAQRAKDINPDVNIHSYNLFFGEETKNLIDFTQFDYIVDAIDTVTSKLILIETAKQFDVNIISSLGTGNKFDPTKLAVCDIYETQMCPLAKVMRRELRKRNVKDLLVVYSNELPTKPNYYEKNEGRNIPGSTAFVPPAAGLIIASKVISDLIL